jgi:hypothetical protein
MSEFANFFRRLWEVTVLLMLSDYAKCTSLRASNRGFF